MKLFRLRYVWLVAATVALASCTTQTTEATAQAITPTTAVSTTVLEDGVAPTTSVAESIPSTVSPDETATKLKPIGPPGANLNQPAGVYGWTSGSENRVWMHRVIEVAGGLSRQTQLTFSAEDDCFARAPGAEPTPVTVARLDGLYLEPYDDDSVYFGTPLRKTTGTYALPIGDRTLCVYLTWDHTTTPGELRAARDVVESIRGELHGEDGIRINYTLPCCWDTG